MSRPRFLFVEPSKVGKYHITLLDGYLNALLSSARLAESFDIIFCASDSTFENLPEATRRKVRHQSIPVINQDRHWVVRKSLLEFYVMARILLGLRRGDVVFVSCIIPPALMLLELFNSVARRRGVTIIIHGEEIENYIEGRRDHWKALGFWGEKWLKLRKRSSLLNVAVIDDFIKDAFATSCSDVMDPARIPIVHYPIAKYEGAIPPVTDRPSVCFVGFRSRPKGFPDYERASANHPETTFLAIGQGKIEDLGAAQSRPMESIDEFMQAITGCSAAILPYCDSYTCVLSAAALDALSVGTHIIATDRPFFRGLADYFGPDFVTIYRSREELDRLLSDSSWLLALRNNQKRRLDALDASKYSLGAVRQDFENLVSSQNSDR